LKILALKVRNRNLDADNRSGVGALASEQQTGADYKMRKTGAVTSRPMLPVSTAAL
jgi:hypothetical protein